MKKITPRKHRGGFTLIELLVVIAVLGILASIALLKFGDSTSSSKAGVCAYNNSIGEKAYAAYQALGGAHNPVGETGAAFLVSAGLLTSDLAGGTYTWVQDAGGNVRLNCVPTGGTVAATLFSSSFATAAGVVNGLMGNWVIDGNGNLVPASLTSQNRALFNGTNGTDYTLEMNATLQSGGVYGIYYRAASDLKSGYIFQYDVTRNRLQVSTINPGGNTFTDIPGARAVLPTSINTSHLVTIQVQGDRHIISIDGVKQIDFTDSTFSSGSVGVRNWGSSSVSINDVTVKTP